MQIRLGEPKDAKRVNEILFQCFDEISVHMFSGKMDVAREVMQYYYSSPDGKRFLTESCIVAEEKGNVIGVLALFLPHKKIKKDSQVIPLRMLIKKAGFFKGIKIKITLIRADSTRKYPTAAYIDYFAVDPKHQGKRIGEKMLKVAEEYAKYLGYNTITLDAIPGEEGAVEFYEKYGYKVIKKAKSRIDKYLMGINEYWYMSKTLLH